MRGLWAVVAITVLGCSDGTLKRTIPIASSALPGAESHPASHREAIPAEWTVAEDTSSSGEITTESVQLPAAKEIQGLSPERPTRLVLRCLDGRVAAFIAPESLSADLDGDSLTAGAVQVQLDWAPACE